MFANQDDSSHHHHCRQQQQQRRYIWGDTLYLYIPVLQSNVFDFAAGVVVIAVAFFAAIAVDANVSHRLRCCHSIVTYYRCHYLNVRRSEDTQPAEHGCELFILK